MPLPFLRFQSFSCMPVATLLCLLMTMFGSYQRPVLAVAVAGGTSKSRTTRRFFYLTFDSQIATDFFVFPPYSKLDYSKTRFCFQFHPLIVIVLLSIHQSFTWKWVIFISQVWHLPVDNYCTALVEDSRWWKWLHLYGTWSNNGVSKCFVASCVMRRSLLRGVLLHSLYYYYSLCSGMGCPPKSILQNPSGHKLLNYLRK